MSTICLNHAHESEHRKLQSPRFHTRNEPPAYYRLEQLVRTLSAYKGIDDLAGLSRNNFSQIGYCPALTLALSPVEREQAMDASGKPLNGDLHPMPDIFSFSFGEKAGMRAGVSSTASFRLSVCLMRRRIPRLRVTSRHRSATFLPSAIAGLPRNDIPQSADIPREPGALPPSRRRAGPDIAGRWPRLRPSSPRRA